MNINNNFRIGWYVFKMHNSTYKPPRVWVWKQINDTIFSTINRPTAGATYDFELPIGEHPLQLYSMGTPNGKKVTIMLEEMLAIGIKEAQYDAFLISITEGKQFSSGFVDINPNSKIPALLDRSEQTPVRVFESGAILLYLARKFNCLLPNNRKKETETLNWLFWLQGAAPYLGGGFNHFYIYAPIKIEYAINRFTMEIKRQLDVLDRRLANNAYLAGDEYTIADIATWPWYGNLVIRQHQEVAEFLDVKSYINLQKWAEKIDARPAVKRGCVVNCTTEESSIALKERHSEHDFDALEL